MNAERANAYTRVLTIVDDLGAAKLHDDERAAVREAADAMLFSTDATPDAEAAAALDRLQDVVAAMVDADRLMPETGEAILDAVDACGPRPLAAQR